MTHDEKLEITIKVLKRYGWRFIKYVTPAFIAIIITSFFLEIDYYFYWVIFFVILWQIYKMVNINEYPD